MSRFCLAVALFALLAPAVAAQEDERYTLGFDGPGRLVGAGGEVARGSFLCTLTHEGPADHGAQGWSIALTAEAAGDAAAEIVHATFEGTDARSIWMGFELTELTRGAGNEGAVSSVAFFGNPIFLPANSTASIAVVVVDAVVPPSGGAFRLRYVDGLEGSSGLPIDNAVIHDSVTVVPVREEKSVLLVAGPDCCGAPFNVGFALGRVSSPEPFEGVLGRGELCGASGGELGVAIPAVGGAHADLRAAIISQAEKLAVQGWTLVLALEGDAEVAATSTEFLESAVPSLDGPPAFERTAILDPAHNGGVPGVVSSVVLSFDPEATLPPRGTEAVLDLAVASALADGAVEGDAVLSFRDGLQGAGEPVRNEVIVDGEAVPVCNADRARVRLRFTRSFDFIRAEANGDGRVNVADPLRVLGALFLGAPSLSCDDAADANDDGAVNVADPLFTFGWLYLGRPPPPPPFPACGSDPTADQLACAAGRGCE